MGIMQPDFIFKDVTRITPAFLKERGLRALVLDVDNTLTAHGSQQLSKEVNAWLQQMKEAGIMLTVVSNNTKKRVAPFAQKIGLEHVSFACKPLSFGLRRACRHWDVPKSEMALVGDQIFTDVLAANFFGVKSLMVEPISADGVWTIEIKRRLEKPAISRYYKHGGKLL